MKGVEKENEKKRKHQTNKQIIKKTVWLKNGQRKKKNGQRTWLDIFPHKT